MPDYFAAYTEDALAATNQYTEHSDFAKSFYGDATTMGADGYFNMEEYTTGYPNSDQHAQYTDYADSIYSAPIAMGDVDYISSKTEESWQQ